MTALQVFTNPDFGQLRTTVIDDAPWFVGKDIAAALGYKNTSKAVIDHVDPEDKKTKVIPYSQNGKTVGKMTIINESGLYSLILSSKLPAAKRFKRWVTSEVLPAIRKSGGYGGQPSAQALADLTARLEAIEAKLDNQTPALPHQRNRRRRRTGYKVKTNPQYNSQEVHFERKPTAAVRGALKSLGFRWYPPGGYWWGYAPKEKITAAIDNAA